MHPVLVRQLRRLSLNATDAPAPERWTELLDRVDRSYQQADQDRYTIERSLTISSREMRNNLALAKAIGESVLDAVLVVDENGHVLSYNRRFVDMCSIPDDVLASHDDAGFMECVLALQPDPAAFVRRVGEIYANPSETSRDELLLRDGRVLDRFSGPVRTEEGEICGRVWCFRDVTDDRKVENERIVVAERMASAGRLVASVAHEINNPLASLLANLHVLDPRVRESDDNREILDDMCAALERIRDVVRDLAMLSRVDETRSVLDMRRVIDTSVQLAAHQVRHRARLVQHIGPMSRVRANASRLGQVVLNLLVNAAQAIPEGNASDNQITIATSTDPEGRVRIDVSDTGAGIAPEHLARIFDPFFTTKAIGSGTGLGLSICKGIVEDHGGSLSVSSRLGEGSCFTVLLPSTKSEMHLAVAHLPAHDVCPRGRVLVIDDDGRLRRALSRSLSVQHDVVACATVREALESIDATAPFDVILCDLMMPDQTGMDFYELLEERRSELVDRVIFLSGGAFTPRAAAFLESSARECLRKPFGRVQVAEAVNRRVRARRTVQGAA